MSPLEILQLVGYSTAAALHFWLALLWWARRSSLGKIERVLLALAVGMGGWHASNLVVALHAMLGLDGERWTTLLRLADTFAVISITFAYSLLLHVHLHLWASTRGRALTRTERWRVYLSYIPALFLVVAVPPIWTSGYAPMFEKLSFLVWPFALWAAYVLCLVAGTDFLIARRSKSPSERRLMWTLAACFVSIGALILLVYGLRVGDGTVFGPYLKAFANLGSLVPTALLAYHIYRYGYFELIIKESLIIASFGVVVLVVYLYGIRTAGEWLTARYGLRAGSVESILILALAIAAAPLRRWLDRRYHQLFGREAALYRDVVTHISAHAGQYKSLPDLLGYIEARTVDALKLRRVHFVMLDDNCDSTPLDKLDANSNEARTRDDAREWEEKILNLAREWEWLPVEGEPGLRGRGYEIAYPLRRESRVVGLMLVDAAPDVLTYEVRAVLEILAGQVAIAVEDCRLVEENVRLERRVAQGERLAALGQMAATVAHEVKNPLSAIKSIAQVMREDARRSGEPTRDLDLIVGETDRLNHSVVQMLNFARSSPPTDAPRGVEELLQNVVELFRTEAESRGVTVETEVDAACGELDGVRAAAVRDALSNLLLNAVQSTSSGGRVTVEVGLLGEALTLTIADDGAGVPDELRERIWEPFFTTRQRGTGLGLAIVRKRIEDVGGSARLLSTTHDGGARFELKLKRK